MFKVYIATPMFESLLIRKYLNRSYLSVSTPCLLLSLSVSTRCLLCLWSAHWSQTSFWHRCKQTTPCAALLCCAQNAQRTLADAIFVRLPQARIENRCALRTLLVEDEFHLLMQFAAKHLAIGVNEARAAHLDRGRCVPELLPVFACEVRVVFHPCGCHHHVRP